MRGEEPGASRGHFRGDGDEGRCLWREDPFRDTGVPAFAHRGLRELIETPRPITGRVGGAVVMP